MRGHLWEQTYLPLVVGRRLLWSPCTTGPLAVARQVCTFHDVVPLEHPEWFSPRFAQWYAWLLPKLAKRVRHIVAVSEFTRGRIVELLGVSPERVTVIPNGVDACFFPRGADEVRAAIQALGWPERYFLCLGVELRKNTIKLLEAWRRAQNRLPEEIHLVLAGAGTLPGVHVDMSATLPPRTINAGYIEDKHMPAAYSGALCLVFPTLYEGFGLPALEAMACGSPVIVSNTTALPEVVGDAGLLVDPTDRTIAERCPAGAVCRYGRFRRIGHGALGERSRSPRLRLAVRCAERLQWPSRGVRWPGRQPAGLLPCFPGMRRRAAGVSRLLMETSSFSRRPRTQVPHAASLRSARAVVHALRALHAPGFAAGPCRPLIHSGNPASSRNRSVLPRMVTAIATMPSFTW